MAILDAVEVVIVGMETLMRCGRLVEVALDMLVVGEIDTLFLLGGRFIATATACAALSVSVGCTNRAACFLNNRIELNLARGKGCDELLLRIDGRWRGVCG